MSSALPGPSKLFLALLNLGVDFLSRHFAFRGAPVELVQLQRLAPRVASLLPMKSKSDFTVRPFDGQDVLVPTLPQDAAVLVGQRLSGLTKALQLPYLLGPLRLLGLHLAAASRRTLKGSGELAHARRKCISIFEESVPSVPINSFKKTFSFNTAKNFIVKRSFWPCFGVCL